MRKKILANYFYSMWLYLVGFVSIKLSGDLVTASPDVFQLALGPDAEFIVLASDGLWDYVKG